MIIFYILIALLILYTIGTLGLMLLDRRVNSLSVHTQAEAGSVSRAVSQSNVVENDATSNGETKKQGYKRNLTIQIPDSPQVTRVPVLSYNPDTIFMREFYKVRGIQEHCFPISMFKRVEKPIGRSGIFACWVLTISLELGSLGLLFKAFELKNQRTEPIAFTMSAICISFLFPYVINPLLRRTNKEKCGCTYIAGHVFAWSLLVIIMALSFFLELDNDRESVVVACWSILLIVEVIVLEPLRTLISASMYMCSKDHNFCVRYWSDL